MTQKMNDLNSEQRIMYENIRNVTEWGSCELTSQFNTNGVRVVVKWQDVQRSLWYGKPAFCSFRKDYSFEELRYLRLSILSDFYEALRDAQKRGEFTISPVWDRPDDVPQACFNTELFVHANPKKQAVLTNFVYPKEEDPRD